MSDKSWDLGDDAYTKVFDRILAEIDTKLLDPRIHEFQALPIAARYLVTRLYYRTARFIPFSDLANYLDQETLESCLLQLTNLGWLVQPSTVQQVLEAASLKEMVAIGAHFGVRSSNKTEVRTQLLAKCKVKQFFGQKPLAQRITAQFSSTYRYYKLTDHVNLLKQAMFLYLIPSFGAGEDVLLRKNMTLVKFLPYQYYPQIERPLFTNKQDFDEYFEARKVCDLLEEATTISTSVMELVESLSQSGSGRLSSAHVRGRATHLVARLLGKQGDLPLEYQWTKRYLEQNIHRGKRSENLIRQLLIELKFFAQQQDPVWLQRGLNTWFDAEGEMDPASQIDLERKGQRLASLLIKHGIPGPELVFAAKIELPWREEVGVLNKSTGNRTSWGTGNSTVEEAALEIYAAEGWQGGHFENGALSTFFMLLVCEIVFGHRESFLNEIQSGPMSMQLALDANAEAVAQRISGNLREAVAARYNEHFDTQPQIAGVNWNIPLECLEAMARHASCRLLMQKLASRYRISGFPDLTLWNDSSIKFVEVKSTNDVLSDTQYIWIKTLLELGFQVEVCKLRDQSKRKRE